MSDANRMVYGVKQPGAIEREREYVVSLLGIQKTSTQHHAGET